MITVRSFYSKHWQKTMRRNKRMFRRHRISALQRRKRGDLATNAW